MRLSTCVHISIYLYIGLTDIYIYRVYRCLRLSPKLSDDNTLPTRPDRTPGYKPGFQISVGPVRELSVDGDLFGRAFREHDLHFRVVHESVDLVVSVPLPAEGILFAEFAAGQHSFAPRGYDVLPLGSLFATNCKSMCDYISVFNSQS